MCTAEPRFIVRVTRPEEVELIKTWSTAEGWNPGLHEGACFFATDPGGFFVGELDGQPVSCISCVAYDDSFGFLGQYIVKPEFRGRGYGLRTWRAGMARLGTRNVGLDGVLAQQSNYERSGFAVAHHHIRYQGEGVGHSTEGIVRVADVPFGDLLAYDRRCFPAPRPRFLLNWLELPESVALGYLREHRLAGFGVARRGVEGFKIGPLLADDLAAAEILLRGLTAETGGGLFYLDAPDDAENPAAGQLVGHFGMRELFRTARMYTQGRPRLDACLVFGITSMELGKRRPPWNARQRPAGKPEEMSSAVGGSFYGPLPPPGTVHLATCFNAIQWLDRLPAVPLTDCVSYCRPRPPRQKLDVSPEATAAFRRQAEQDLKRFLECRARELVTGGKLLLASPGDTDEARVGDGLIDVLDDACLDLVAAGRLDRERFERLTLPVYCRTVEELLAPLNREDSSARDAFAVDRAQALEVPTPFFVEFRRGGDVAVYAEAYTGFLRAFSEQVVRAALNLSEGTAVIRESLYERVRARLPAEPERYLFRYILVAALLSRR